MYRHTQTAPIGRLLYPLVAAQLGLAWFVRDETWIVVVLAVTSAVVLVVTWSFGSLTIQDEGDFLGIGYGPLPLVYKRIAFDTVENAERGHTKWIDGWGIHWVPGRGMTYNLWGFDCVKLTIAGKTVRLGTDDPEGLLELVESKLRD